MEEIQTQIQTSRRGTSVVGTGPNSNYALAECYRDLSVQDCALCYEEARRENRACLPHVGSQIFLDGRFVRTQNYNFFEEYTGRNDTVICGYRTKDRLSWDSVTQAVSDALKNRDYFARAVVMSWPTHESTYVLADCWGTLNENCCKECLEKASVSIFQCFPWSEGRALHTGCFFEGVLPDGKEIAAKRLFFNQQHRAGDFYHEVNIISSVDHKNLVKLVGFSCSGPESILIYEYLPNKSLNHFIFDSVKGKELNWAKRFNIIVGIAEGLAYLHENNKTRIIHRDIKAANILLDSRLRAKIADFGLARSFQEDKNHISTGIAGTLGYMAPEYVLNGNLTEKVDVYSFGVLLLEVVTGIPNRGIHTTEHTHSLVSIAWMHFKQGSVDELFDHNLMLNNHTSSNSKKEIQSVIQIGLLCTQEVPSLRPTMSMTLQMLSKNIEPLPSPANPHYMPLTNIKTNQFGSIDALRHRVNDPGSLPSVNHSSLGPR